MRARGLIALSLALLARGATAEEITGARYVDPVDRYGHFAPGRPHEYARLAVELERGRLATFDLGDDEVFEDVAPRVVHPSTTSIGILTIVSNRRSGSRLVLFEIAGRRLSVAAQSPAIGMPYRWLNPVGVADLDGDGRAEIVAVITPHVAGRLTVYRQRASRLVELASLGDVSNHVYGTPQLALSAIVDAGGRVIVVPDQARRALRIIRLERDRLVEVGRCGLPSVVVGPIAVSGDTLTVGLAEGTTSLRVADCLRKPG